MTPAPDSAQVRLVASRKALVRQMARVNGDDAYDAQNDLRGTGHSQTDDAQPGSQRSSVWQIFSHAAKAWWQYHPVQVAVDIGRPFLSSYARDKPLRLLGIAAAVGAVAVLVKPWRLVSFTGLAIALFKTPKLSASLLSLLPRAAPNRYSSQTQQPSKDTP